ncbi:MAG: molybdopterin molybdotransferase MoeA [Chloroflexi bacterium]|nr:molybdopterin molybdotransferase MoeA [Chloroflexota bacterium]
MISVEEAQDKILSYISVLETEAAAILDSLGQVLAEDIYAPFSVPPLDNSAMDGYAVLAENTRGAGQASPKVLKVIGQVAAGYLPSGEVGLGTAMRIMTGAPIPSGADAVAPFEDTDEVQRLPAPLTHIAILREVAKGANIRRAGEDIAVGELVLGQGIVLHPSQIGILASLGRSEVRVIRRPVIGILATGDELVELGETLAPGKIYNSNSFSLAAQVRRYGGVPRLLGIAKDTLSHLEAKIKEGLDVDMLITSAGVSTGDYDVVKDVLAAQGEIAFWTVRMKPGKPLAFGVLRGGGDNRVPHLGLPGNPVSSMIAFEQFGRPAILKMLGYKNWAKPTVEATLEEPIKNSDGRRVFARAIVTKRQGQYFARLTGPQGSGILTSMAQANGLVVVPEDVPKVEAGDRVKVQMLDWGEES